MCPSSKTTLVADNFHYPIPISELEKLIISTEIFNRLHNILQNSTVYLTYPSNRTTRFIHSLGCMHITGQIFQHSINNARRDVREKFFESMLDEIKIIQEKDKSFKDKIRKFYTSKYKDKSYSIEFLDDKLYLSALPGALCDKYQYAFIVTYQALRIAALLHDIGHPPFSHVIERALEELKVRTFIKKSDSQLLTPREERFFKIVNLFKEEFHEALGKRLTKIILAQVEPKCTSEDGQRKIDNTYTTLIIYQLVKSILWGKRIIDDKETDDAKAMSLFDSLHKIISSNLDADRLDYVSRDLFNSGMLSYPINYGRLISSYQLVYEEGGTEPDNTSENQIPLFLPSVRSLSTIEDFFRQRFNLWKYVIYHHRVTKTDGLLKSSVIYLAEEYLLTEDSRNPPLTSQNLGSYLLPQDISGLWTVMGESVMDYDKDTIFSYIQWDDAWLLSILRKKFLELKNNNDLTSQEEILQIQLEELLSNKKHFYSLFKRVDTFIPIDEAFLKLVPEDFDWTRFEEKIMKNLMEHTEGLSECPGHIRDQIETITLYSKEYKVAKSKKQIEKLRESNGFFLTNIALLLELAAAYEDSVNPNSEGMEFAISALDKLVKDFKLTHAIIVPRRIRPGVNSNLQLVLEGNPDQIINLGAISRIADDLQRSSRLFPPFFIYTYKDIDADYLDIEMMRRSYGEYLWEAFITWFEQFPQRS